MRERPGTDELSLPLLHTEGARLREPVRRALDPALLARHRERFEHLQAA